MTHAPGRGQRSAQHTIGRPSAVHAAASAPVLTPIARHARLKRSHPVATLAKLLAAAIAVVSVSAGSVAAIALWDVSNSFKKSVTLVDAHGSRIPSVGALSGGFNVLLAGSDSGGGNAAYGERGENLNDVTMLLHVSADHRSATVVSFPRDLYVPIPECPREGGGTSSAMRYQKINTTLTYGGLGCTVLTLQKLTGLTIPYAALIQFDGVVAMSNAIGGVSVCVAGDIRDPYTGLDVKAGQNTLSGQQALAFLRTRHGVGDGSDLGRISNQQVFLSALMRQIKSADTLTNPAKVYALAKAAAANITPSESIANITTIASMGVALKDVDLAKMAFVQFPNRYVKGGVEPDATAAAQLTRALQADTPVTLSGTTGVGSQVAPGASAAPSAGAGTGASAAPRTGAGTVPQSASSTAAATPEATLPESVHGQTAAQQTCSKPYED